MPNAERVERSTSQQRQVDPQLIFLLKDFKANPHLYTPERTQQLLKPYRESGELDYLMKNKEVLTALVNSAPSAPSIQPKPQTPLGGQYQEGMGSMGRQYKDSVQRSGSTQPNTGMGMNMGMGNQPHHFVPKAEKFRTVPCKYYHRYVMRYLVHKVVAKQTIALLFMMNGLQEFLFHQAQPALMHSSRPALILHRVLLWSTTTLQQFRLLTLIPTPASIPALIPVLFGLTQISTTPLWAIHLLLILATTLRLPMAGIKVATRWANLLVNTRRGQEIPHSSKVTAGRAM